MSSRIATEEEGEYEARVCPEVDAVRLDNICSDALTLINMDIERAEYDALLGARRIIQTHKPKLAISVYHRDDDLCRIPQLIHET
jgi:FkbM family methyltransferase